MTDAEERFRLQERCRTNAQSLVWNTSAIQSLSTPEILTNIDRIAFVVQAPELINHYRNIWRHLDPSEFDIVISAGNALENAEIITKLRSDGHPCIWIGDVLSSGKRFAVALSNHWGAAGKSAGRFAIQNLARRLVRLTYALGKANYNFSSDNRIYDLIMCFGPYQVEQFLAKNCPPAIAVGYPRFDDVFNTPPDRRALLSFYGLDPVKKTVLWLPTWQAMSSIETFASAVSKLRNSYNLIAKVHFGTATREPERMALLRSLKLPVLISDATDNAPLLAISDYVLVDYGGSAFSAIYMDRNLILLDVPGATDYEWAGANSPDLLLRNEIVHIGPGDQSRLSIILADSETWSTQAPVRKRLRDLYFAPNYGTSGRTAADVLRNHENVILSLGGSALTNAPSSSSIGTTLLSRIFRKLRS